ncbi:MAG: SDR family oxidoreductase [Burkholderiaceae bacterium]
MSTPHRPDGIRSGGAAPPADPRPVALVTGGARRVGRAIALELARGGFDIALHHRSGDAPTLADLRTASAELRGLGARVEPFRADFSDPACAAALVPEIARRFGRLDAVVNSASRFEYDRPENFDAALLESLIRSNTAAPIALAQALAAQVGRQAGHRIAPCVVNLLDQKLSNPNPDYFSYTLAKAALKQATVLLAQALAPSVRVCGVSPGVTLASGPMTDAEFDDARKLTALGRSSTPGDIARAVRFLIESPAITGVDLAVDGGQHLIGQTRDVLFLARDAAAPR